jgi:hypothetical protein
MQRLEDEEQVGHDPPEEEGVALRSVGYARYRTIVLISIHRLGPLLRV